MILTSSIPGKQGMAYDPQSPQKYLLLVLPESDLSIQVLGFPVTLIAVVGVGRLSANLLAVR